MDLVMLVIVAVIVIPGYFIVSYFTRVLYSQSNRLDESVEAKNNSQPSEDAIDGNVRESKDNVELPQHRSHKRAGKKMVRLNKKGDSPVLIKYRKQIKGKKMMRNRNKCDKYIR